MASQQGAPPPSASAPQGVAPPPNAWAQPSRQPQGRNNGGRNLWNGRGQAGRGPQGRGPQGRGPQGRGDGPVSIAPTSGIPYGHVPAYLPGSSSLVEELDKRVLIVLRDGRHLVGTLRSFDQFSNMVLEEASERKIHRTGTGEMFFADVPLGVYIIRGDSMVLLGQVAPDDGMKKVEPNELEDMIKEANKEELPWDFDRDLLA